MDKLHLIVHELLYFWEVLKKSSKNPCDSFGVTTNPVFGSESSSASLAAPI